MSLRFLVSAYVAAAVGLGPALGPSLSTFDSILGHWEGVVASRGRELRIDVDFAPDGPGVAGRIDIPDLYVSGYRLEKVRLAGSDVSFELPFGAEPDRFSGVLRGNEIIGQYTGRFYQSELRTAALRLWRERRDERRYSREDVQIASVGATLAGTLFLPHGKGPHQGVVLLHGSGPQTRDSYLRYFAERFAAAGVAALIFDKRGSGASTGTVWFRTGDRFDLLTGDAGAAVAFLAGHPAVAAKRVGVWGLSQGAWLAPLAASRSSDIAFVVMVSGGGVTPAEQELYDDQVKLRSRGFSSPQIEEAVGLLRLADDVIRGREAWSTFAAARARAQTRPWYEWLDRYPAKLPEEDGVWRGGAGEMDYDPGPTLERTRIPVLALFGESDTSTPTMESARRVETALHAGGNRQFTVRVFPRADHGLWVSASSGAFDWERPAAGWVDLMLSWVRRQR